LASFCTPGFGRQASPKLGSFCTEIPYGASTSPSPNWLRFAKRPFHHRDTEAAENGHARMTALTTFPATCSGKIWLRFAIMPLGLQLVILSEAKNLFPKTLHRKLASFCKTFFGRATLCRGRPPFLSPYGREERRPVNPADVDERSPALCPLSHRAPPLRARRHFRQFTQLYRLNPRRPQAGGEPAAPPRSASSLRRCGADGAVYFPLSFSIFC
jgi:hypothetical protein